MKSLSTAEAPSFPRHRQPTLTQTSGHLSPAGRAVALLIPFLTLALAPCGGLAKPREASPTHREVDEKKGDLKDLRGQIDSLRKGVAAAESTRNDAADQLKSVEQEISGTQRELHTLGEQRDRLQAALKELANQSRELQGRLARQQTQLEKLVYRQYLQGQPDSLRLLLNGSDSNQMTRDLYYLTIIAQARRDLLDETQDTLRRKQAIAADTQQRAGELAAVEARQKEQHGKLLAQREQRKLVLEKISAKIAEQRRTIGNLQRDEKQLTQVIERLAKAIAEQQEQAARAARAAKAAREAKEAQAARAAQQARTTQGQQRPGASGKSSATAGDTSAMEKPAPTEVVNDKTPQALSGGDFAQHKGNLRLPIRGQVSNRFGTPRQEGGSWKGLFIRAASGTEVRAIAAGRVVFADWMRGFGNIVIVDHGGSYLSIYGNNEALMRQNGDSVHGGDIIASVGASGGNPESGLYFELRHQGQPIDPLKWINLK